MEKNLKHLPQIPPISQVSPSLPHLQRPPLKQPPVLPCHGPHRDRGCTVIPWMFDTAAFAEKAATIAKEKADALAKQELEELQAAGGCWMGMGMLGLGCMICILSCNRF